MAIMAFACALLIDPAIPAVAMEAVATRIDAEPPRRSPPSTNRARATAFTSASIVSLSEGEAPNSIDASKTLYRILRYAGEHLCPFREARSADPRRPRDVIRSPSAPSRAATLVGGLPRPESLLPFAECPKQRMGPPGPRALL